jgi:hypothetical protein
MVANAHPTAPLGDQALPIKPSRVRMIEDLDAVDVGQKLEVLVALED